MKKLAIATLALAAISTTACSAFDGEAKTDDKRPGMFGQKYSGERMGRDGLPRGFDKLNLSQEQKNQIKALMQQNQQQRAQMGETRRAQMQQQLESRRVEEQRLLQNPTFDEAAARQLLNQRINSQQQQMVEFELKRLQHRHAIFQILTPEQRAQWQQQQAERRR